MNFKMFDLENGYTAVCLDTAFGYPHLSIVGEWDGSTLWAKAGNSLEPIIIQTKDRVAVSAFLNNVALSFFRKADAGNVYTLCLNKHVVIQLCGGAILIECVDPSAMPEDVRCTRTGGHQHVRFKYGMPVDIILLPAAVTELRAKLKEMRL